MKRIAFRWLLLSAGLVILFFILGFVLSIYLERTLERKITTWQGRYTQLHLNLVARTIEVHNLQWNSVVANGDTHPHRVSLKSVKAAGIHFLPLLLQGKLIVDHLTLDSGNAYYNKQVKDDSSKRKQSGLSFLRIHTISVQGLTLQVGEDSLPHVSGYINGVIKDLTFQQDTVKAPFYSIASLVLQVDTLLVNHVGGEYRTSVKRLYLNTPKRQISLDSLFVTPLFGKYEFANRLGEQRSRISMSIPYVLVKGWEWEKALEKSFSAKSLHIHSFDLRSFKDKRLPISVKAPIPLPMKKFGQLAWAVKIDSVVIHHSRVMAEVFPESGNTTGLITFDNLQATLTGLNNRWKKGDAPQAILRASGLLMNTGNILGLFHFPLDGSAVYSARGSISKMELATLNQALGSMADLRITSGYLQDMSFAFRYTEYTSTGRLDMGYENLHILGLNKNKKSTHELKTALIRFFTARNKSKSAPLSQAVGHINIERDRQKFIFNVWWKSILDGIQSSILGNRKKPTKKDKR